jgi:glycosyltransferase involved in cell wall biosynthesis
MNTVHLTASPFFGGPERQMLGLARATPADHRPVFLCFREHGLAQPFVEELEAHGAQALPIERNTPHLLAAIAEVAAKLRQLRADILLCHGYKPDIIGYFAARRVGIPVISVSRGWTAATAKVRAYEWFDRRILRSMDHVVCVSEGQARKVRAAGVAPDRITVIRNSIDIARFTARTDAARAQLERFFHHPPRLIALAVGRLSPEKGFERLVDAARIARAARDDIGFVLIGDGALRDSLQRRADAAGLQSHFIITGFRRDVDALMPAADLLVQSSYTEGLPNVVLEAMASSLAVVATDVGGTSEVVVDHRTGFLVPPADSHALGAAILSLCADDALRLEMGDRGRQHVAENFTFDAQRRQYERLLSRWTSLSTTHTAGAQAAAV